MVIVKNWPKLFFIRGGKGPFNLWCFSWPYGCPAQITPVPVPPPNPLRYFTSSGTNQPISKHLYLAVWLWPKADAFTVSTYSWTRPKDLQQFGSSQVYCQHGGQNATGAIPVPCSLESQLCQQSLSTQSTHSHSSTWHLSFQSASTLSKNR